MQTNEALTQFNFNGLPIQAIEHEGDLWMTGEDVGRALEYSDPVQGIRNLFNRNKSELEGYSSQLKLSCETGVDGVEDDARAPVQRRPVRVFNEEGVMILTMLSSQPKAAEFRMWAVKILKAYRHGELALNAGPQREAVLIVCIKEARFGNPVAIDTLIRRYGYPETIRREIRGEMLRRVQGDPAQCPDLVDWFIEGFLPTLRAEIESEDGTGPMVGLIRLSSPMHRAWKLEQVPGARWALRHRTIDLYNLTCDLAAKVNVDADVTVRRFARWLIYSEARIKAGGWVREAVRMEGASDVFCLKLLE
jgi:prophage antirepressor-like protein